MPINTPLYEIYSLIFFATAVIYILVGTYVLSFNIKNALNKAFFFVFLSLGIWAYSYSLVNSAVTYEDAIFWSRISVLVWGLMFSFLNMKFSYVLIYLPSVVNLFVFGLNTSTAMASFEKI